jgi:hypothetical protein
VKDRILCALLLSGVALWPSVSKGQDRPSDTPPKPPAADAKPADSKPSADTKPSDATAPATSPTTPPSTSPTPAPGATPAPGTPPAPAPPSNARRLRELEEKVEKLNRALAEMKSAPAPAPTPATPPTPPPPPPDANKDLDPLRGVVVSGYVQAQLENHDDSEDQLRPGGAPYNQNRFLIRRGRLKVEREWEYSSLLVELDGNTTKGPAMQLFRAEASLLWRGGEPQPAPPVVKLTMGLFDVPFGYELVESSKSRFFMERSLQSRAFFPAEPDLGIRLGGSIGWFRYALGVMNGEPLGEPGGFAAQDPNNHKDFIAHFGASAAPVKDSEISGGVSLLEGKGFVKGTDATKNQLAWNDDGNATLQDSEIIGVPASSTSPSYNFDRWAVGADLQVRFKTDLGQTKVYGELQLGSNMDRALFIASPTISGPPSRELGYYIGLVQEITPYAVVGFRTDFYNPDADFLGFQSGKRIPVSETVRTQSPLIGLVVPGHARLVFQYDFIKDHMGRDANGLVTDLKNDEWTLRLQGDL